MRTSTLSWLVLGILAPGFPSTLAAQAAPPPSASTALLEAPVPAAGFSSSTLTPAAPMGIVLSTPARPKPPRLRLIDWSGIGAVAVLRALDYTSTEQAIADPQHFREAELPTALVDNKPAFAAFEAGTVVIDYAAYRILVRRHLRPLAMASQFVYTGIMADQVGKNYALLGSVSPH